MSRELISCDSLISSEELLKQVSFTNPIHESDLGRGTMTRFSLSDIEIAYPLMLKNLGFSLDKKEWEFDELGSATYLGTQLHRVDALAHYLTLPVRPSLEDFFPTQTPDSLLVYKAAARQDRGYLHNYHNAIDSFLSVDQVDFDAVPHDLPISSGFKIVDVVAQRTANKEALMQSATKLLDYWVDGGSLKLGINPNTRNYREVTTILGLPELGLQCSVRLDGLILGGAYNDLVIELKTGSPVMKDSVAESIRYRQAQMLAFAAGILLKTKQRNGALPSMGKAAILNIKSLENSAYVFRYQPVRVLYRYFGQACGDFNYEGFEMDENQAEKFIIWLTALAKYIRIDPNGYKKQVSKEKAINF